MEINMKKYNKIFYIFNLLIIFMLFLGCDFTKSQEFKKKIIYDDLNTSRSKIIKLNSSLNLNFDQSNQMELFFTSNKYTVLDGYTYYDLYAYSLDYLEKNKTLIELNIYRINVNTLEKKLISDDSISYKNHLSF